MKLLKVYSEYSKYVEHQKEKTLRLANQGTPEGFEERVKIFVNLFSEHLDIVKNVSSALCIGARSGHEVVALQQTGVKEVKGIDLVPCPPYVEKGDMHSLPYPAYTFDFVFSNIFDHSNQPPLFIYEIERVLKVGGYALLHLLLAPKKVDDYAENKIDGMMDVIGLFERCAFHSGGPMKPSKGYSLNGQLVMKKVKS